MKTKYFFISTLLILAISCNQKVDRTEDDFSNAPEETTEELKADTNSYFPKHEEFVQHILDNRLRKHDFEYVVENCRHHELFPVDGLQEIVAYSDKNYPKSVSPTYYEHFTLFCLRYSTADQAKVNFDNFYLTTQLDTSKFDVVEQSLIEKQQQIIAASKPGGLIVQENEWIYSLVETCRETPIGGNWVDYENLFLSYIGHKKDSITVLNADCGNMTYKKEKRTTHNRVDGSAPVS